MGEGDNNSPQIAGVLDAVTDSGMVQGWAWYPELPARRARLEILADGLPVGTLVAELERPDLSKVGIGDGRYGYSWRLPLSFLSTPGKATVTVREAKTDRTLPKPVVFEISPVQALLNKADLVMVTDPIAGEAALLEAVKLSPGHLPAHLTLARLAHTRGDHDRALSHFQAAADLAPEDVWRWIDLADEFRLLNQLDEAESALCKALARQARNVHIRIGFGRVARARGERQVAAVHFRLAAHLTPNDAWRWIDLAEELRALGRLEEAEVALRQALGVNPSSVDAMLGLGHCARAKNDRTAAARYFAQAAALAPHEAWPQLELAQEQRDMGDFSAARATALSLLEAHPNDVRALFSLGRTANLAGSHKEAVAWLLRLLEVEPNHLWAMTDLAAELYDLGEVTESQLLLERVLALDPVHPGAITGLARQAKITGDLDRVEEIYAAATELNPAELTFQFGLVDTIAAKGRVEDALTLLEDVETSQGTRANISAKRIAILRASGRYPEALEAARAATACFGNDFYLWVERFHSELAFGNDAELAACLHAMPASSLRERAVQARCAGAMAEKNWQLNEALAHYQRAVDLFSCNIALQEDLVRVKLLKADIDGARENLRQYCALQATDRSLRGESQNISQTILGQILDEYAMDGPFAKEVASIYLQEPEARLKPLCDLVKANPDHTLVAVSLLVALRQAGKLTYRLPSEPGPEIPRKIYKFWDSELVPDDVRDLVRSWEEVNPDYQVELFNNASAERFLATSLPTDVQAAYRRVREPAQKADIFRLALLAVMGGVYSDADDRCFAPLSSIIPAGARLVLFQENLGSSANNFIAVTPGHPVIVTALQKVVEAVLRGDADTIWLLSGPGLLTRVLAGHAAGCSTSTPWPEGTALLTLQQLHRAVAEHCHTGYKNQRKHWSNTLFRRDIRSSISVSRGSSRSTVVSRSQVDAMAGERDEDQRE